MVSDGKKRQTVEAGGGGSGFLVKLIFAILLISFSLTVVLFFTDYKSGQAATFINTAVPVEFREQMAVISSGIREKVKIGLDATLVEMEKLSEAILEQVEKLSKQIPIGEGRTLDDVVFSKKKSKRGSSCKEEGGGRSSS